MINDLKPYPAYKDSGVPWLGSIPSDWEVRRNGRLFAERTETGFPDLPILEVSLKTGVRVRNFDSSMRKQVMTDKDKYKRARQGDIAYNMMRMWQGAVGVAPVDGLISPAYVVARPFRGTVPEYFAYLFRTDAYMGEVNNFSRGIVSDRNRLYWDEFKQMPTPSPPPDEQALIVRFLDLADRRIRRYIKAKRRLIALLNEQKQSVVYRAVTRGLDPNARLKPSGIEWIGDVPEHWKVVALGRVSSSRCDGPFGSGLKSSHYTSNGVRVIRLQNIRSAEYARVGNAFISEEHYATLGNHDVVANDLLVAGLGDDGVPAGRACVAPVDIEPAMVKADCFRFRLNERRILPLFAALQLSSTAKSAASCLSTGATRQRINLQTTSARKIAFPTITEQKEIVHDIESKTNPIMAIIVEVQRQLDLVRDYRARLIADVVTGKLDVREAVARLPDETEDQDILDDVDALFDDDDATDDADLEAVTSGEEVD